MDNNSVVNPEDTFKIMIATDAHLGYNEKKDITGDDSFRAFEEILQLSVENDVDFILLGGDLFDEATPSQNTLHECMKLLRKYTLGDKPIEFELLSDQEVNFAETIQKAVNYEDPNNNIAIPVFSIHGNHDDPSGYGRLSSLDLLSVNGLVNYFGKWTNLTKVNVSPILMKKGETQLALYGLSHIHDNRLHRLFAESKVIMETPDKSTGDWFNIMVLHQNRADRGVKNFIPEEVLPGFLDLIVWGHEHDCRIQPEANYKKDFFVTQPGSSVVTSLSEGESLQKHCGILHVNKKQFKLQPIPLKTVRPFIFRSLNLDDMIEEYHLDDIDAPEKVMKIASQNIEEMIQEAKAQATENQPKEPLIRLRIFFSNEAQTFHPVRFSQRFSGRIANPTDAVLFKNVKKRSKIETKDLDKETMDGVFKQEDVDQETRVEELVDRYFAEVEESKQLQLTYSKILSIICDRLVNRDDTNAAESVIRFYKEKANKFLLDNVATEENIDECITQFKSKSDVLFVEAMKMLDEGGIAKQNSVTSSNNKDIEVDNDDHDNYFGKFQRESSSSTRKTSNDNTTATTTRGRGRGRGSRGGRGASKVELDVTRSGSKQQTLSSMIENNARKPPTRTRKAVVYEVSDSD